MLQYMMIFLLAATASLTAHETKGFIAGEVSPANPKDSSAAASNKDDSEEMDDDVIITDEEDSNDDEGVNN